MEEKSVILLLRSGQGSTISILPGNQPIGAKAPWRWREFALLVEQQSDASMKCSEAIDHALTTFEYFGFAFGWAKAQKLPQQD